MAATFSQFSSFPLESFATPCIIKHLRINLECLFCPNLSPNMSLLFCFSRVNSLSLPPHGLWASLAHFWVITLGFWWTRELLGKRGSLHYGHIVNLLSYSFPFNVLENPMYVGSTLCFLATALWYEKPAGILITLYVWIVYIIALRFEG